MKTLSEPSADQQQRDIYGDLRTAVEAVAGIQEVSLLHGNQNAAGDVLTATTIPEGTQLVLHATANVRID